MITSKTMLLAAVLTGTVLTGCSMCDQDIEPCVTTYRLKFKYDHNMKYADAFPNEVGSVAVWAFDQSGKPVWHHTESGEALASDGYSVEIPLPVGKYDFVSWCGLSDDEAFSVETYEPKSKEDLVVHMNFAKNRADAETDEHSMKMEGLYHNLSEGVELSYDSVKHHTQTVTVPLIKDTNYIKVLLQNLSGKEIKKEDFSFYITADTRGMLHDNTPVAGEPYRHTPWNVSQGMTNTPDIPDPELPGYAGGTIDAVSTLLAEFHTGRLMADGKNMLVVHRNTDNKDVVRIPLIEYLLLVKGHYRTMSDQEYLDRSDEHDLIFVLDENLEWALTFGLYINSWRIVPPQGDKVHP